MRLQFDNGRAMYLGRRPTGGIALQQGTSRVLLSTDEIPVVLAAIAQLMSDPTKHE